MPNRRVNSWHKAWLAAAVFTLLSPMYLAYANVGPASVTTVAGSGVTGNQNGPAMQAQFLFPTGIAIAQDGTMYISDTRNQRIRAINAQGDVSTVAGSNSQWDVYGAPLGGYADGSAMTAEFNNPMGLALTPDGKTLYVADSGNGAIRRIDLASGQVTSVVKGLADPSYLVIAPDGTLDVSETDHHRILQVKSDGSWSVLAGGGYQTATDGTWIGGYKDGTGEQAQFQDPQGLALAKDGTLYVADSGNQRIRAVSPRGVVTTLAGSGATTVEGDTTIQGGYADGYAAQAQFNFPSGLALGPDGTLYVADTYNHCVRAISPQGLVDTVAGSQSFGRADGFEDTAQFDGPTGIAVLPDGNLATVDLWTDTVRKITWYQPPQSLLTGEAWEVVANDQVLNSQVPPMMIDHHLYLPLDALAKAFGMTVSMDSGSSNTETVTIPGTGQAFTVQVGNANVTGDLKLVLPKAPISSGGAILVPWEFATNALGLHLTWMPAFHLYLLRSASFTNGS